MVSLPVVLLIFITSNYPQEKLNEGLLSPPTAQPQKGFVDNGKSSEDSRSQVNDLTTSDFKFPDDHSRVTVISNKKIIREKLVPDNKEEKDKIPVPLYSLVKNDCGEGYALDENGVCQKTIAPRGGKTFDADRRRKRNILDYEWMTQRKKKTSQNSVSDDSDKSQIKCSEVYPGMVSDGKGGCKKSATRSDKFLSKTLPP